MKESAVDKKNIHLCLRSRDEKREIYDINTLMYVVLHELAHVISTEIGHGEEFKRIFKTLVQDAISIEIYKYVDYSKNNVDYCGMILKTNIAKSSSFF